MCYYDPFNSTLQKMIALPALKAHFDLTFVRENFGNLTQFNLRMLTGKKQPADNTSMDILAVGTSN